MEINILELTGNVNDMDKEAWNEHFELKEQVKELSYYPALAAIYKFIDKHSLIAKRNMNYRPCFHRFKIENVIVDFLYKSSDRRKYS